MKQTEYKPVERHANVIKINTPINIKDLANLMNRNPWELIIGLVEMGIMATSRTTLTNDQLVALGQKFRYPITF